SVAELDVNRKDLRCLAAGGALQTLVGHRRLAHWAAAGGGAHPPLDVPAAEGFPELQAPREGEDIVADYASLGLTLSRHPLALLRPRLRERGFVSAEELCSRRHGSAVRVAGLV